MTLHSVPTGADGAEEKSERRLEHSTASWLDALPVGALAFTGDQVVGVNAAWTKLTGLDLDRSAGDGWLSAINGDDRASIRRSLARARAGSDAIGDWRLVGPNRRGDVWAQGRAHHVDGAAPVTRVIAFTEMDPHTKSQTELMHLASHDSLTGLLNRRAFYAQVDDVLASAGSELTAVLFVDLDRFKEINDRLGHKVGDVLLAMACRRLRSSLRATDCAGRLGGDEMGVLCPSLSSKAEAVNVAKRVMKAIAEPFDIEGETVHIGASVGVAFSAGEATTAEALVHEADGAMYRAKARCRVDSDLADHRASARLRSVGRSDTPDAAAAEPDAWLNAAAAEVTDIETTIVGLWRHSIDLRDETLVERLADASHALHHAAALLRDDESFR